MEAILISLRIVSNANTPISRVDTASREMLLEGVLPCIEGRF
jgi:hypothetical protein